MLVGVELGAVECQDINYLPVRVYTSSLEQKFDHDGSKNVADMNSSRKEPQENSEYARELSVPAEGNDSPSYATSTEMEAFNSILNIVHKMLHEYRMPGTDASKLAFRMTNAIFASSHDLFSSDINSDEDFLVKLQRQLLKLKDELAREVKFRAIFERSRLDRRNEAEQIELQFQSSQQKISVLQRSNADLEVALHSLRSDYGQAKLENEILRRKGSAEITEYKMQISDLQNIAARYKDFPNSGYTSDRSPSDTRNYESTIANLKAKIKGADYDIQSLHLANETLRQDIEAMSRDYNQQISRLTKDLELAQRDVMAAHHEIKSSQESQAEKFLLQAREHEARVHKLENLLAATRLRMRDESRQQISIARSSFETRASELEASVKEARLQIQQLEKEKYQSQARQQSKTREIVVRLMEVERALSSVHSALEAAGQELGKFSAKGIQLQEIWTVVDTATSILSTARNDVVDLLSDTRNEGRT